MTTRVRFVLSYDFLKLDFIAFEVAMFSMKIYIVVTDIVNEVTVPVKVLIQVWSYDFYDMTLSTGKQRRHMINTCNLNKIQNFHFKMSRNLRKQVFGVSNQVRHKPACMGHRR